MEQQTPITCIFAAHQKEAHSLIHFFRLKMASSTPFRIYRGENISLIITGEGPHNMATAVGYMGKKNALYINIGTAGHKTHPIGSAFLIHKIIWKNKTFFPSIPFSSPFPKEALLSRDVFDSVYPDDFLVDMESAAFFSAAKHFSPLEFIQVIKVISDNDNNPFNISRTPQIIGQHTASFASLLQILTNLHEKENPTLSWFDFFLSQRRFTWAETQKIQHLCRRIEGTQCDPTPILDQIQHPQFIDRLEAFLDCQIYKLGD